MSVLMLCIALLTGMDTSMTAEEQATRECHFYCDDVEGQIQGSAARCGTITDNKTTNNNFNINDKHYRLTDQSA